MGGKRARQELLPLPKRTEAGCRRPGRVRAGEREAVRILFCGRRSPLGSSQRRTAILWSAGGGRDRRQWRSGTRGSELLYYNVGGDPKQGGGIVRSGASSLRADPTEVSDRGRCPILFLKRPEQGIPVQFQGRLSWIRGRPAQTAGRSGEVRFPGIPMLRKQPCADCTLCRHNS